MNSLLTVLAAGTVQCTAIWHNCRPARQMNRLNSSLPWSTHGCRLPSYPYFSHRLIFPFFHLLVLQIPLYGFATEATEKLSPGNRSFDQRHTPVHLKQFASGCTSIFSKYLTVKNNSRPDYLSLCQSILKVNIK